MSIITKGVLYGIGTGLGTASSGTSECFLHMGPSTDGDIDLVTIGGLGANFSTACIISCNGISITLGVSTTSGAMNSSILLERFPLQKNQVLTIANSTGFYGWVDKIRSAAETAPTLGTTAGFFYRGNALTYNVVDRLDYTNEVVTQVSSWLGRHYSSVGLSNTSQNAGYAFGGVEGFPDLTSSSTRVSTVRKYSFSTDTHAILASQNLSGVAQDSSSVYDSTTGHIIGGADSGNNALTRVDKFVFSTQVCSASGSTLGTANSFSSGVYSSTNGYNIGGQDNANNPVNTVTKIVHSTSTLSTLGATLASGIHALSMGNSSSTKGYARGGATSNDYASSSRPLNKFTFSGETMAVGGQYLDVVSDSLCVDSSTNGYMKLGYWASSNSYHNAGLNKIDFTTETIRYLKTSLYAADVASSQTRTACFNKV